LPPPKVRQQKPPYPRALHSVRGHEGDLRVLAHDPIVDYDIKGGAEPLLLLHLYDASLPPSVLLYLEACAEEFLAEAADKDQQLAQPLLRLRAYRDYGDLLREIPDPVEALAVEPVLRYLPHYPVDALIEPLGHERRLLGKGVEEGC